MSKIDLTTHKDRRARAIRRARERGIIIPTFAQMKDPAQIPPRIKEELRGVGLWDLHPRNLFRISWHNEPVAGGGGYRDVNYLELPSSLTGVPARIVALLGKWFPTGAHKVGAAFGCLAPRLVTGQFDPTTQMAVWPSTGNFCRGGAYDAALLGCGSIAILPEGMSRERFDWLAGIAGEIIRTPGSESNVKEIFDQCRALRESGRDLMIFNQFEEFGNYLWHYEVTGRAVEEAVERAAGRRGVYRALVSSTGSAGTIAAGDYMKKIFPASRIVAAEALQCPTLLENGFGSHRIEGIGDKHVPWIHNVRNTDMVAAVDDEAVVRLARLFNEPAGRAHLAAQGVPEETVARLDLLGFSGIANVLAAVKAAKYFEWGADDIAATILTDSMELYRSRLEEMRSVSGEYTEKDAVADFARYMHGASTDNLLELSQADRRRIHNLKYFTWVEQQGMTAAELTALWSADEAWAAVQSQAGEIDERITEFNAEVGLG